LTDPTLYLIFALFSGLLGTAFSVLVRRCALLLLVDKVNHYSTHIVTATRLVGLERVPMNIASLYKAPLKGNRVP